MSDDIVTVLRQRARWCSHGNTGGPYDRTGVPWNEMTSCLSCVQELAAADEIERLQSEVEAWRTTAKTLAEEAARLEADRDRWNAVADAVSGSEEINRLETEIERLRAAGDKVAMYLDAHYGQGNRPPSYVEAVLQEWQEARRG